MASSMTIPTARVSASSVMLFSEKSMPRISVKVAMMEAGIATAAISTARQLRMKSQTTTLARMLPRIRCSSSEWTEALMKSEMSWTTRVARREALRAQLRQSAFARRRQRARCWRRTGAEPE